MNIFAAGRDLVRWEVTALNREGPYRLVMHHPRGKIIEYFNDMSTAMIREAELEALLVVVATHGSSRSKPSWIAAGGGVH